MVFMASRTITQTVTILPVLMTAKISFKLLLTFILQIVSHFDLRRPTPLQLGNQSVQSKWRMIDIK